jgi:hypothetical protein
MSQLSPDEQRQLQGMLRRADKELAHMTTNFREHDEFCTVDAFLHAIAIIERLLRDNVYNVVIGPYPFPDLQNEKRIYWTGYEVLGGPLPLPDFPRG